MVTINVGLSIFTGLIGLLAGVGIAAVRMSLPYSNEVSRLKAELEKAEKDRDDSRKRNRNWSDACEEACRRLIEIERDIAGIRGVIKPHFGKEPMHAPSRDGAI